MGGQAVRLTQGAFDAAKVYNAEPVAQAVAFAEAGAEWIHLVDLDGAKAGHPVHLEVLRGIAEATGLPVQFGGGLRTSADMEAALAAGQPLPEFPEKQVVGRLDNTWHDTAEAVVANWIGLMYQVTHRDRKLPFMDGVDPNDPLGVTAA
jgi:hypothetical protein